MSENELKTLSSAQTFFMKVLFPPVWISMFGLGTLALWFGAMHGKNGSQPPEAMKWLFLLLWLAGTAFILWGCAGLKRVRVDSNFLYVSNYLREISVPLKMISDVEEIRWINIHPVTVHFRSTTDFGRRITFMPRIRMFALWSSHPVVAELKHLAGLTPQSLSNSGDEMK
jgi:hypothetical protein